MSDSDTQCLIEAGEIEKLEEPGQARAVQHLVLTRRVALRAAGALAVGAVLLVAWRRGAAHEPREAEAVGEQGQSQSAAGLTPRRHGLAQALEKGMMQLALQPAQCSAYADCAALPGSCCPTEAGTMLGCCTSPRLDATTALSMQSPGAGPPPPPGPGQCADTEGWTNGYWQCALHGYTFMHGCMPTGLNCRAYDLLRFCANGAVLPGKEWAVGSVLGNPEQNCCVCGKAPEIGTTPPAPQMAQGTEAPPAMTVETDQTAKLQTPAPATTLGPPAVPTIDPAVAQAVPPVVPTVAPLAGAAAPNGTQGEVTGADCAAAPQCKELGITGQCCPTADGTMLGCCSSNLGAGPPALLPPASGPGPLMTFYMYRVANDEDYPLNGINAANLAGDMWYLHNEVVQHCPRKFNMERLLRFKVTARATPELFGQKKNFDSFVAFDQAKCTVPRCAQLHWDPLGYVVGCQPNNIGQVAVPGSPVWYSLPGTCPNKFYYEKTEACNIAEPGGACPTSEVTGARNCTYHMERAGEIRLDDLSGLTDYNQVCRETGVREYDLDSDVGIGTKFWNGKTDAAAGARRIATIKGLFAQAYPSMPADFEDPVCDVQG